MSETPEIGPFPGHRHYRQPQPWGCMYYAFAALTGEELFEHVEDCSIQRFLLRAFERGYFLWPVYRDELACRYGGMYASSELWHLLAEETRGRGDDGEDAAWWLLLGVPSLRHPDNRGGHTVAVLLSAEWVRVFDPGEPEAQDFTVPDFTRSPYARAFEVFAVQPADLEEHPVIHGPSMPHAQRWLQRQRGFDVALDFDEPCESL